jgi:galactokinase
MNADILNKGCVESGRDAVIAKFEKRFNCNPDFVSIAPGRVNLIGGHVDYNGGLVLPMAVDRHTFIAGAKGEEAGILTVHSIRENESFVVDLACPMSPAQPNWTNYVRGVVHGFLSRGIELPGLNMLIDSTIPSGSGLSSSASLEVATAGILEAASGVMLKGNEKPKLCQQAEHEFANVPCGIMDQFSVTFAKREHMLLLDCRDESIEQVAFDHEHLALAVINSQVRHELSQSEYAMRRESCESISTTLGLESLRELTWNRLEQSRGQLDELSFLRAEHVVRENERTLEFVHYMKNADWFQAGEMLYQSHASLREKFQVSCAELDELVDAARQVGLTGGVLGARMTGAGFGGCVIMLVEREKASDVVSKIVEDYNRSGATLSRPRASGFVAESAEGAQVIKCAVG